MTSKTYARVLSIKQHAPPHTHTHTCRLIDANTLTLQAFPTLGNNLEKLLHYDGNVEETFALNFGNSSSFSRRHHHFLLLLSMTIHSSFVVVAGRRS
jgi:hypothetical protein